MIRVRFAPSPTGFLHIGGLRTALYNELFALHGGGEFILRIEDTDRTRFVPGAVESLIRTLAWAGIHPVEGPYLDEQGQLKEKGDKGPYIQSQRQEIYRKYVDQLLQSGHAYRCYCTAECLDEMKKSQATLGRPIMYDKRCCRLPAAEAADKAKSGAPHVVRLRVPETSATEFDDAIRGHVKFENATVDDQVLLKSDGFPTYHLANVVDDHEMGITHVIRGEEWLPSTPKHVLLYQAFGWLPPTFAHIPLLLNADRSKLSKRQGDVAVEDYRKQGYMPEAIINFVALLGWNPSGSQEIYAKEELVKEFDLGKVNKSGAVFNRTKLDWLNREYIKRIATSDLVKMAKPFLVGRVLTAESVETVGERLLARAIELERSRINTLADFAEATEFYFQEQFACDPAILPWKKSNAEVAGDRLTGILELAEKLDLDVYEDPKLLEARFTAMIVEKGWTNAETLWPMRVALTGRAASPSPFEVAWALGKEKTVNRLKQAIRSLK